MAKSQTQQDTLATQITREQPAWLANKTQQDAGLGMETARQNRVMPRLVVVQGTSGNDLIKIAGAGGVVTKPDNKLVLEVGAKGESGTFDVIPIAAYTSWQKRADNRDKDSTFIVEESFDPRGTLARLASNPATRSEPYAPGDDRSYTICEAMNWVLQIADCPASPDLVGRMAVVTFAIGELYSGKRFASHLCDAYPSSDPIFVKRVRLTTSRRERNGKAWWGIDVAPTQGPTYIDEGQYEDLKSKHLAVADLVNSRQLVAATERGEPASTD